MVKKKRRKKRYSTPIPAETCKHVADPPCQKCVDASKVQLKAEGLAAYAKLSDKALQKLAYNERLKRSRLARAQAAGGDDGQ